ncbi:MAG TPA: MFS transporter, partial [Bryobacteraceae bacterium]|nr:MFS transporter [Bryobacteraceae bacterium]
LDRGQIEDWFGSTMIRWTLALGVLGWIATVLWELRAEDPVIDFRLLKSRNFAIASAMFLVFGFGLFGSTTLLPQMLQQLYGYRAIDAGLVLGPGALVITVLAPLGAQLIQRQIATPRALLILSSAIGAFAMWNYASFTLATDYRHYLLARCLQGLGYAFFFVPASLLAYSQLRPDQNNRASSLTNLFRNWGGSMGVAFIITASERRFQYHQSVTGSTGDAAAQQLPGHIAALKDYLIQKGFTGPDADLAAPRYLYHQLQQQVSLLSFMDCFQVIGWVTLAAIPLLFLVKKFTPTGKAPAAH